MTLSIKKETKLLSKHFLVYGLGNFLNQIAAFLLLPLYTQYLTPKDYGIKELIGLSSDIIGILISTAISSAVLRFYFEYQSDEEKNEVISTSIIALGSIGFIFLLGLSFAAPNMAGMIIDSPSSYHYFIIMFTSLWFNSINNIGNEYLRANQRSLTFILISIFKLFTMISINVLLIVKYRMGVVSIFISTLITSIFVFIILIIPLLRKIRLRFSLQKAKEMFRFGVPMIVSQLGASIVHISDRFFIKGLCSIGDVGIYSLGYRFGTLPNTFITSPFIQIWLPRRMELFKRNDAEAIFGRIFTYFLLLIIFVGVGISVLSREVITIISNEIFWPAYKIVPIIMFASVIFSLHYHFNIGILIQKKTKYLAYINASNAFFILILNYFLIKRFGIYGAAIATLIGFTYKVALTYYVGNKYYKIHFEHVRILKIIVVGILVYILASQVVLPSAISALFAKSLIVMLFPLILFLLKFFSDEEKRKTAEFIKPRYEHLKLNILKLVEK